MASPDDIDPAELDALNEQALAGMRASAQAAPAVAIAAPAAESAAPERINVVGEAGDIRNVAPEELAAAEQAGYRRAGELALQGAEERQYAESAAGIAQTAAEQAAQGATLGGYGLAAGLVDEGYQQRLEQRAEYNPITAGVAQVVGAAAPALLSGGTSLGARALAATPAAALERLGARAGTSAAKYFGGGAIVRGAVAGAVEGGLGNAAMEAAAGEDPIDVLKSMGTGVVLGGALGGAFGAAERGVEKIRGKLDAFAGQRAALRTQAEVDALHALDAQTAPPPEVTAENLLAAQETGLLGELPTDRLAADVQPVLDEINTAAAETSSAIRRDLNAALPKVTRDNVAQYVDDLEANARLTARERLAKSAPDQLEAIRAARGELDDEMDDIAREIEKRRNRIYDVRDKIDTDDALDAKIEKVIETAMRDAPDAPLPTDEAWWNRAVKTGLAKVDDETGQLVLTKRLLGKPEWLNVTPERISTEIQALQDAVSSTRAAYGDAALAADGGTAALRRVELQIADIAPKVAGAIKRGDMARAYVHLDRLKRVTQRVAKRTKSREVQQILREKEEIFRQFLMDESQWGQIAVLQREFNGPWADYFLKSGDSDIQSLTKMRSGERAVDPYETAERVNGSAMRGFLDGIGSQKTETAERAWRSELAADVKDLVNRARLVGTDADQALATQAAEDAVAIDALSTRFAEINAMKPEGQRLAKLQEDLEKAAKQEAREATKAAAQAEKEAARDARDVAREQRERAADIERKRSEREDAVSTIGAAMGAAIGGAPGAAIGFALGKLPKVIRAGKTLLAQGDQLANERVVAAASGFLRATQRAVAATGRAVPVGAAISASRVADALARATELADPESPASADLMSKASKLDVVRPGLGAAYAQAEMTRAEFIASKMPPTPPPAVIGRAPRMDPISERKLNRYVAAAYYPEKALARVANGSSTLEDRQVLQVLYPQRWQAFVSQVEDQLARAKRPPTYAQRARIAHQAGIVTMPSADPANIPGLQAVADANAADAIAAVKGESAPASDYRPRKDPNKVFGTRADEVLSGD